MTQRQLARRIVEQAYKHDWMICVLCEHFNSDCDCPEDCSVRNKAEEQLRDDVCVEGVRAWLMDWRQSKEEKSEEY